MFHPGIVSTRLNNFKGQISAEESAEKIISEIEKITLETSGVFKDVCTGEIIPW
jgi:hypothetical protein